MFRQMQFTYSLVFCPWIKMNLFQFISKVKFASALIMHAFNHTVPDSTQLNSGFNGTRLSLGWEPLDWHGVLIRVTARHVQSSLKIRLKDQKYSLEVKMPKYSSWLSRRKIPNNYYLKLHFYYALIQVLLDPCICFLVVKLDLLNLSYY